MMMEEPMAAIYILDFYFPRCLLALLNALKTCLQKSIGCFILKIGSVTMGVAS
jgi:hypothetical protein